MFLNTALSCRGPCSLEFCQDAKSELKPLTWLDLPGVQLRDCDFRLEGPLGCRMHLSFQGPSVQGSKQKSHSIPGSFVKPQRLHHRILMPTTAYCSGVAPWQSTAMRSVPETGMHFLSPWQRNVDAEGAAETDGPLQEHPSPTIGVPQKLWAGVSTSCKVGIFVERERPRSKDSELSDNATCTILGRTLNTVVKEYIHFPPC